MPKILQKIKSPLSFIIPGIGILFFIAIIYNSLFLEHLLRTLFPNAAAHLYERRSLSILFRDHLLMVSVSCLGATIIGISMGIFLTRSIGKDLLPFFRNGVSLLQTLPPVAVLVLVAPILGFGTEPTVFALLLFSILPILNNTISGIAAVPPSIIDASLGLGMTPVQLLWKVEIPIAARVISAGIRTSVVINIATATIGAVIGAGGFGILIIAGLVRNNPAFIFSGAIATTMMALLINWVLLQVERRLYSPRGRSN